MKCFTEKQRCFISTVSHMFVLPADISKVMQAKKKRLECLTKNYMKGSQHKLEQLWNNYHSQRLFLLPPLQTLREMVEIQS